MPPFLSHCVSQLNSSTIPETLIKHSTSRYLRGACMKETNCNGCPKQIHLPDFVLKPKVPPRKIADPAGEYLDVSPDVINETNVDELVDNQNAGLFTPKDQASSFKVNTNKTKYEIKQAVLEALILRLAADPTKAKLLGWLKEYCKQRKRSAILCTPLNLKHPRPSDYCVPTKDNYYADLAAIYAQADDTGSPFYDTATATNTNVLYDTVTDSGVSEGIYDRGSDTDSQPLYTAATDSPTGSNGSGPINRRPSVHVVPMQGGGTVLYDTSMGAIAAGAAETYDNVAHPEDPEYYGFVENPAALYDTATPTAYGTMRPDGVPGAVTYDNLPSSSSAFYDTAGAATAAPLYDQGANNTVYGASPAGASTQRVPAPPPRRTTINAGASDGLYLAPTSLPHPPTPPNRRATAASTPGVYLAPTALENPYGAEALYVSPTYAAANSSFYEAPCTVPVDAKELDPVIFPCGCVYHLSDVLKASDKISHFQSCYYCNCAISRALPPEKIYNAIVFIIPGTVREALVASVEKIIVRASPRRQVLCRILLVVGGVAAVATVLGVVLSQVLGSGSSSSGATTTTASPPLADTDLVAVYNQTRNASGYVLPEYGTFIFDQVLMVINNTAFAVWNSTTAVACQAAASQISVLTSAGVATVALLNRIANVFIGAKTCNVPPSTTTTTSTTTSTKTTITTTPTTTSAPTTLTSTTITSTTTIPTSTTTTTTAAPTTTSTSSTIASTLTSSMTTTLSSTASTSSTTSTTAVSTTAATTAATTTLAQTTPVLTTLLTTTTPTTTTVTIPTATSTSTTITTTPATTTTPTTVTSTTTTTTTSTTPTTTTQTTTVMSTTASSTSTSTTSTTTTLITTTLTTTTTTTSTSTTTTTTTSTTTSTITTTPTTTTVTTTTKTTTKTTTFAPGNTNPTAPDRRRAITHTPPQTTATIPLTTVVKGALNIAIEINQAMYAALTTFSDATGRRIDQSLVIILEHQLTINMAQSAVNYAPRTVTAKVINRVLNESNEYLRKLNPTFAQTDIELPPLRGRSQDALNQANLVIRRNLAAMGCATKPGDYVQVKASEVIKAAMREEMYKRFYNPYKVPPTNSSR